MSSEFQRIFLTGFMGSGKTYWGELWSEKSGFEFIDIDKIVEKEQDKTITQIFSDDGEEYFRSLETNVLKKLITKTNVIVATGGGTPCYNDNITWMNENGTCIYLQSSPKKIYQRLINEREKRPLIKNLQEDELLFYISEKIKERESFYKQAQVILNVDELTPNYLPEILNV